MQADPTDFYPLTPLQEGMLFHSIGAPKAGVYFNQCIFSICGTLNVDHLALAWQQTTEQHDILRTFFIWDDLKVPVQVVDSQAKSRFEVHDWRDTPSSDQVDRLESFLSSLREQNFDLNRINARLSG